MNKIMKKYEFTEEEFFSNFSINMNIKINLLCELNEKGIFNFNDENYYNLEILLDEIRKNIELGYITNIKLEEFLKNKKEEVIKRLGLIKIIRL